MNQLPATVRILDRPYKIKVRPEDEQFLRQAADLISSQTKDFGKMYAHQDGQDLLAMVALTQIAQYLKLKDELKFKDTKLDSRLTDILKLLDTKVEL